VTYSQNIIRVIKCRKIREENVVSKRKNRNEYRNLLGKTLKENKAGSVRKGNSGARSRN